MRNAKFLRRLLAEIHEAILRIEAGDRPIRYVTLRIEAGGNRTPILNTQLLTEVVTCKDARRATRIPIRYPVYRAIDYRALRPEFV